MAKGPDNVKILYETNKDNPQSWYFQGELDARMKLRKLGGSIVTNPDGSFSLTQNDDVYLSIDTNDKGGVISRNQLVSSAKGFMRNIRDWRSTEQTIYFLVDPANTSPDSVLTLSTHIADPYASRPNMCLGQGYHFQLYKDGRTRFAKSLWFPSGYLYTPTKSSITDLANRWIGIKLVCVVVKPGNVKLEVYVDEGNLTNNWQLLDTITDSGGWGGQGLSLDAEQLTYNACGGTSDQVLDMGAPNVVFAWFGFGGGFSFKNLAVREIGPKASITDLPVQRASGFGSQKVKFGVQPMNDTQFYPDSENFQTEDPVTTP